MSSILITGADGHLGRAIANSLLDETAERLVLYCREGDQDCRNRKMQLLGHLAGNPRCSVVFGDLDSQAPFDSIATDSIRHIIHCAAATDFGIELDVARRVNVDGTLRLLDFARQCPGLDRFVYLSTLYVAGLRNGEIGETFFDNSAEFANHYEWSKWQAEHSLETSDDIPWQIFRIGTLLCDDDSGKVSQFNVVHNTLRLLYYGLLSVFPGEPGTRLYVTTTADAVGSVLRQMDAGDTQRIFNVACCGQHAPTLGQVLDRVFDAFMRDPRFAKHGILKPLFCDRESFDTLVHSIDQFGGAMSQSLQSIAPFAPQLFSDKDVSVGLSAPTSRGWCTHRRHLRLPDRIPLGKKRCGGNPMRLKTLEAKLATDLESSVHVVGMTVGCSNPVLSPAEQIQLDSLHFERRRSDWILGRTALKELLRSLGRDDDASAVRISDPQVSISHSDGIAIAVGTTQGAQVLASTSSDFVRYGRALRPGF